MVAVEPSADEIGASLLRELRGMAPPGTRYIGCGGRAMARAGFASLFPIDAFSIMGATDVLKAMPLAMRRARQLALHARDAHATVAVFIDGWAFSRLAATRLRRFSPETTSIKYVAPQVWASRPRRVQFVKDYFDGVLALFPFELSWFEREGIRVHFAGNPNFQAARINRGDGAAFRARHGLGAAPLLCVLLGSRRAELRHHARPFREAVEKLRADDPMLKIVAPLAPGIAEPARNELAQWNCSPLIVDRSEKHDAFAAADAALAVSGTVSTELAINGAPMVVAYRVDPLTALWARRLKTTPYAAIINIAADECIIPEFIQERCAAPLLAAAVGELLRNPEARAAQRKAAAEVLKDLRIDGPPASREAASKILEWARLGESARA